MIEYKQHLIDILTYEQLFNEWNNCMHSLKRWDELKQTSNHYVFAHSECFLVAYSILIFYKIKDMGMGNTINPKIPRELLLLRLCEDQVNKIIIIAKDICKRTVPIYKEQTKI